MLLKLITLITLVGNFCVLIYFINGLRYIQYEYEYISAIPSIILFALNVYIIFGIYRKNKLK